MDQFGADCGSPNGLTGTSMSGNRGQRSIRPLRVLHFLCTEVRAGVGEHALSLLMELYKQAFIPYVVAPAPLLQAAEKELRDARVRSVAMDMSSPLDWREIKRLGSILRLEQIDIVHCHMAIATFCAAPIARLSGVPVVIETGHGREIWREGKLFRRSFWFDRQIAHLVKRYIAVSEAVAWHLIGNKRIPASKVTVIRNGRDLSRYQPAGETERLAARREFGLGDEPVILMVSRFSREKGHDLLLDAVKCLAPRWPGIVVMLAGDGPLQDAIRARCEREGLKHIRFLGYRADSHRLFAAADVVVLPSLIEGLPLTAIEALAAGRPVVATAVGGTPEIVIHGETGFLTSREPHDMAAALERLLADASLRRAMGISGRRLVEQHFDVRTQIEQTLALYWQEFSAARQGHFSSRSRSRVDCSGGDLPCERRWLQTDRRNVW